MRVAIVIPRYHPVFGGGENQCRSLSRYLRRSGRVSIPFVVTKRIDPALPPRDEVDGVAVVRLESPGISRRSEYAFYLRTFAWLARRRHQYDVIHCHATSIVGFAVTLAGRLLRKPVVLKLSSNGELLSGLSNYSGVVQLDRSPMGRLRRPLARFSARYAHIVALNDEGLAELRLAGARRAELINNGVDTERFHPPAAEVRARLRRELGFGNDFVFLYTGRFVVVKGIDVLLAAIEQMPPEVDGRRLRFCFVGTGSLQWQDVSAALGSAGARSDAVRVFPPTDDVVPFLHAADAFVFPSRREGMPNAVLEALAAGLPCVLSDIVPHRDLAAKNPDATCLLARSGDPAALADALERCVRAVRRGADQPAAGAGLAESFRMEAVAERYIDLYTRAAGCVSVTR